MSELVVVLSRDSSSLFISSGGLWRENTLSTFTSALLLLDLSRALLMVSPPERMPLWFEYAGSDWGKPSLKEQLAGPDDALLGVTGR